MKYVILFRGINISGKNKISMPILKDVLTNYGFKNVVTCLNSGNVILETDILKKNTLEQKIFEIVKANFNLEIPIFVMTEDEIKDILNSSPDWWGTENKNVYDNLICIIPPMSFDEIYKAVGEPSKDIDKIKNYKNYIFWSFDLKNYRKSNWWIKTANSSIKDNITIRTANTLKKVLALLNA